MISILIPTYNYNIFPLVEEIHKQASNCKLVFEILVLEDASSLHLNANEQIKNFKSVSYLKNPENFGRTKTRQLLAEKAQYETLLFLDADVMPRQSNFIKKFAELLPLKSDVVFGGISYLDHPPIKNEMLRWKYGKSREGKNVEARNQMPHQSIISQSVLIKKKPFLLANPFGTKGYGLDVLFSIHLEKQNTNVLHIHNPIIHLGLENSTKFLKKSKEGLKTLAQLTQENKIPNNYRPIQKAYLKLVRTKSVFLFQLFFGKIEKRVIKNLVSNNPSLFWFDLYRLYHYSIYMK